MPTTASRSNFFGKNGFGALCPFAVDIELSPTAETRRRQAFVREVVRNLISWRFYGSSRTRSARFPITSYVSCRLYKMRKLSGKCVHHREIVTLFFVRLHGNFKHSSIISTRDNVNRYMGGTYSCFASWFSSVKTVILMSLINYLVYLTYFDNTDASYKHYIVIEQLSSRYVLHHFMLNYTIIYLYTLIYL